jgi:cation:H+ antiporter
MGTRGRAFGPLVKLRVWAHHVVMPVWSTLAVFAASLAVMSWASARLAKALERIGVRLRFSDGLLGLVTALGADAPEICSAFAALLSNQHEIGLGVVLGSNIFNLAGLLGLSALVAGRVTIGRQGLWFNGGTSLVVSVVVVALVLRWIPVWSSLVLLTLLLVPYVALLAMHPRQIARLQLPPLMRSFLDVAIGHAHRDARKRASIPRSSWKDAVWALVSLTLIVGSSAGAVRSAVLLAGRWGVSQGVVGMVVLAALTSVPNVIAAVELAREGRGAAVVSESLNSNTLNILVGVCLPALLIGFAPPSPRIIFAALWLLCMKLVALAAASHRHGLRRDGGAVLALLYLIFALTIVLWK